MADLTGDEMWRQYEKSSQSHKRAMKDRLDAEFELARRYSEEALVRWDSAHRDEERCYEELKSSQRAIWAKYRNI